MFVSWVTANSFDPNNKFIRFSVVGYATELSDAILSPDKIGTVSAVVAVNRSRLPGRSCS